MKHNLSKAIFAIASSAGLLFIASCNKMDQKQEETVSVYLTYTITTDNGEVMHGTKANSADVFNEFYQKIKSGELVAPNYNFTFTEKTTGAVYTVDGTWAGKDMVTLRTGTYKVVGTSKAAGENIQDKCSLKFDDEITVDVNSTTITLKATYDCSLIIFSDASIDKLSNFNGSSSRDLFKFNNYIYAFVNSKLYADGKQAQAYLEGQHTNGTQFKIYTGNLNYEIGKFYVYNDINAAFSLDEMEEGGAESSTIPCNQIWYTSTDGKVITPESETKFYNALGQTLTYTNVQDGDKWVMTFSDDIAYWSGSWFHNYPGTMNNRLETLGLPSSIDPEKLGKGMLIPNGNGGEYIPFYGARTGSCIKYFYGQYEGIADDGHLLLTGKNLSNVKGAAHMFTGTITVPEGVTTISGYAFHMTKMSSLVLPSTLKSFGEYCLEDSDCITSIYCYAKACPTTYSNMWFNVDKNGVLHYPIGSDYSKFNLKSGWTKVADL